MLWQSVNEACEVCQCSRLIKNAFQLNERYSSTNSSFSHQSECLSSHYDNFDNDKENQHLGSPVKHDNDISLYGNSSPSSSSRCMSTMCSPSPKKYTSTKSARQAMEEFDLNSQDSGYGIGLNDKESKMINFSEPNSSVARKSSESLPKDKESTSLFHSFSSGSMESMDDEFLELVDLDDDDNTQLPCNFSSLISGSIKNETPVSNNPRNRPTFRRSISLKEGTTPVSRARHCLFKPSTPELFEHRPFKRPEPPMGLTSPVQTKRYKCNKNLSGSPISSTSSSRPKLQRSFSAVEANIMSAVQRSSTDPDLIGDFSKPFCLPLVSGRHQDLKSISPSTLADLMCSKYDITVASYKVIDCRYPYEYEGGHINGALNFYTKEQIMSELVEIKCEKPSVNVDNSKRHILVFHCEFSSERGPNLSRFLRNLDRTKNNDSYPALHYPEIYLLDGGYKSFYEQYSELCEPVAYKSMLDPAHGSDLRHFRAKSKTWNADTRSRFAMKSSSLKRLGFP